MTEKKVMTLKLSAQEMEAIEELARRKDVTKTAVVKQAVRLLMLVENRMEGGGKLFLEDDKQKTELAVLTSKTNTTSNGYSNRNGAIRRFLRCGLCPNVGEDREMDWPYSATIQRPQHGVKLGVGAAKKRRYGKS